MPAARTLYDLIHGLHSLQTHLKHSQYHLDLKYTSQVLYSGSNIL